MKRPVHLHRHPPGPTPFWWRHRHPRQCDRVLIQVAVASSAVVAVEPLYRAAAAGRTPGVLGVAVVVVLEDISR